MESYNLSIDLKRILESLEESVLEFSESTEISRPTLISILENKREVSKDTIEKIYSYAYANRLNLNRNKELIYLDDVKGRKLLFHGAQGGIEGKVDTLHSVPPNDFGNGFYTGESLKQAASWVAKGEDSSVYCFYLEGIESLRIKKLISNMDWLFAVLYYRGAFKSFEIPENILSLINEIEESDLIIAPIADNEMFKTIDSFARNEITDEACMHAISATNLGFQYVFKSQTACDHLSFVDRLYLCKKEKEDYILEKNNLSNEGILKSRFALNEYRREGRFFDEIFQRKR